MPPMLRNSYYICRMQKSHIFRGCCVILATPPLHLKRNARNSAQGGAEIGLTASSYITTIDEKMSPGGIEFDRFLHKKQ